MGQRGWVSESVSGCVGALSVGECLQSRVSVKCFHAGCRAFTSLALKVKGIESLQDVPGRDFWLCQQRAGEQASFSLLASVPSLVKWGSWSKVLHRAGLFGTGNVLGDICWASASNG